MVDDRMEKCGHRCWFPAILAILLVLHLAKVAAFIAAGQGPLQGDAAVYWWLGQRVAAGDWLLLDNPPEITRTPGYPYFVAFFQLTCGRRALAAAIIAQHLLLLASAGLASWTCWRLTGKRSAIPLCLALSLACFSCHGVAVMLLSDPLLYSLLTLSVALVVAWRHSPSWWLATALGLTIGAAVLTKPAAQLAGLIAFGWMFVGRGSEHSWRKRAAHCGLALVAAAVLVAPWLMRNQICFGQAFLTRVSGRALWWSCFKGNPADRLDPPIPFADGPATRTVRTTVTDISPHDTWRVFKKLVKLGYSESDADDLMLRGAKEAIRANPGNYVISRCRRYVWFWLTPNETFRPNTGDFKFGVDRPSLEYSTGAPAIEDFAVEGQDTWSGKWYFQRGGLNFLWRPHPLWYGLAALAAAVSAGLLAIWPQTRDIAVFFALWLGYFSAVTALFGCPAYRYRMILEPAMIVLVVTAWETVKVKWQMNSARI